MIHLAEPASTKSSNLAFALRCLPADRREPSLIFYRFCRTIDDIADDPSLSADSRVALLQCWREALESEVGLPGELVQVIRDYGIPRSLLLEILSGCESDVLPQSFLTMDDLRAYCWKVACAVGLVSIRIFGCRDPRSEVYALHLGYALQFTNILRDVAEDRALGRVYLPCDLLSKHGVDPAGICKGEESGDFLALATEFASYAESEFKAAGDLVLTMDRKALLPAEIMKAVYWRLLQKMRRKGFDVLTSRHSLPRAEKFLVLLGVWLRSCVSGNKNASSFPTA